MKKSSDVKMLLVLMFLAQVRAGRRMDINLGRESRMSTFPPLTKFIEYVDFDEDSIEKTSNADKGKK